MNFLKKRGGRVWGWGGGGGSVVGASKDYSSFQETHLKENALSYKRDSLAAWLLCSTNQLPVHLKLRSTLKVLSTSGKLPVTSIVLGLILTDTSLTLTTNEEPCSY